MPAAAAADNDATKGPIKDPEYIPMIVPPPPPPPVPPPVPPVPPPAGGKVDLIGSYNLDLELIPRPAHIPAKDLKGQLTVVEVWEPEDMLSPGNHTSTVYAFEQSSIDISHPANASSSARPLVLTFKEPHAPVKDCVGWLRLTMKWPDDDYPAYKEHGRVAMVPIDLRRRRADRVARTRSVK